MRYIRKQQTKTDCGVIAVLNSLKWAGYRISVQKDYYRIRYLCDWVSGDGTNLSDLEKVLKTYKRLEIKKTMKPQIKTLDNLLSENKCFILLFVHKKKGVDKGHFVFGYGKNSKHYLIANGLKTAPSKISRAALIKLLKNAKRDGRPWSPRILEIAKKNSPVKY